MTVSVHNPDQYMPSLRQIIAQGRKRIGLLVGAGAPAGIFPPGSDKPLIPAVAGLTDMVMDALKVDYGKTLDAVRAELETPNIETILSRVRSLAGVIGKTKVHDLDGEGYKKLSEAICEQIGTIVNKPLHDGPSPYTEFVTWISGTGREHPVEIFTTNYDLPFEQALERTRIRATYWDIDEKSGAAQCQLGRFDRLARFFASSSAAQHFPPPPPTAESSTAVAPPVLEDAVAVPSDGVA